MNCVHTGKDLQTRVHFTSMFVIGEIRNHRLSSMGVIYYYKKILKILHYRRRCLSAGIHSVNCITSCAKNP